MGNPIYARVDFILPVMDLEFGLCVRWSVEQRYRLLPYLKSLYHEWGARGRPLVRPLHLHYPDTRALGLWRQFLLGQASQFLHKTFFHPFLHFATILTTWLAHAPNISFLLGFAILKVLSSEMDQAKSGLILLMGEVRRFSANFALPHPVRAIKIPRHLHYRE
jgi:hypothetical protein